MVGMVEFVEIVWWDDSFIFLVELIGVIVLVKICVDVVNILKKKLFVLRIVEDGFLLLVDDNECVL